MKKILIGLGSIALALAIFAGGVYANEQGWLRFSGDDQIAESEDHLDEIMDILRQVNDGKITAEQGLETANERIAELEDMNPSGLAKKNKELREKNKELEDLVAQLNGTIELRDNEITGLKNDIADLQEQLANAPEDQTEYVAHLEAELERANSAVESHHQSTTKAVQEARTYTEGDQE